MYVATSGAGDPPEIVHFESDKLSAGHAERCPAEGAHHWSVTACPSPAVRIVDPDTRTECPEGTVGEIWVHGDNVSARLLEQARETERTFGGTLVARRPAHPKGLGCEPEIWASSLRASCSSSAASKIC